MRRKAYYTSTSLAHSCPLRGYSIMRRDLHVSNPIERSEMAAATPCGIVLCQRREYGDYTPIMLACGSVSGCPIHRRCHIYELWLASATRKSSAQRHPLDI